ncbi:hypothetical protein [Streptomyces sp. NBC_00151]|uniref:hypothetical protein n=1 Tax=Streptomyces sp. NBC_00151 TaxID=2975669 RepID=UPI002DD961CB|nr:hypothetical protein [Streptomyces sp. NBC_00151]WRZ36720.1 hypothetical protein OG915_00580 [Streptomyces sp. NBC_00151]WRZ44857.1 hypothetical protein OG915_46980 [Streptomyces sp. NBC_00151]
MTKYLYGAERSAGFPSRWDDAPVVVSAPENYAFTTEGELVYVTVVQGGGELGYLWAADADSAAGWEGRPERGDDAFNAGVAWIARLREAKARGLVPARALVELADEPETGDEGRIVPGPLAHAVSLAELRERAAARPPGDMV